MNKIDKFNCIFSSSEFINDELKFNIILTNLNSPNVKLYSDELNYIVCKGDKDLPTWIWTRDEFDKNKLYEIVELIKLYLIDDEVNEFTCKKELYDLLIEDYSSDFNFSNYFEMGFLTCSKSIFSKKCDAIFLKPDLDDKEILVEYFFAARKEMNGVSQITIEDSRREIEKCYETDRIYVLKNMDGKIVSMVCYGLIDNIAKLTHMYTPLEEREKGYATNLIYRVTSILLDGGYTPLLYTDYNYPASNKAYKNAGYKDCGFLVNFTCACK